jgi:2-dehydropantoate 2-reductase
MSHRYAIIGTGAIGGLYGGSLARAGSEVHFLCRSDYAPVRAHGLRVDSVWGDFTLDRVNAYASAADMPECDGVLVCTKTTSNRDLPHLLAPLARPGTAFILMQNGLDAEEEIAAAFPQVQVGGAMCFVCSNRVGPGHIHHLDYGQVTLGAHTPGMDELLDSIVADFERAKVPVEKTDDLRTGRWMKLVWNIPFNGLSVVLGAGTDAIMSDPATAALARELMLETLAGARADGRPVDDSFADIMLFATRQMKPYKTSMALDYEAGRPLEIEYLYRHPLEAARRAGVSLPRVEMLATLLEHLDAQRRAQRK